MNKRIFYLVLIFLEPGQEETLRQYEQQAVRIMAKHGGGFERVLKPVDGRDGETVPDEIHLLSFESEEGFALFRADPELEQYRSLREAAVSKVTMFKLADVPLSLYFSEL